MGQLIEFDGISGYRAGDGGPGVVVLHEWWGLVPHIFDVTDRFAAEGFEALAPDLYHGARARNDEPDLAEKLMMQQDRHRAISEARLAIAELRRRGCAKVGIVGFCLGGALALAVSGDLLHLELGGPPVRQDRVLDATVAFYGIWPKSGEQTIATPVLVHVAEHEEHNPPALPENFPKWFAGMDNVQLHIYAGTQHAFFNDTHGPDCYDEANARLAWGRTIEFLRRHLA
jgi:carboxymethylenebutenolidase